MHILIGYGNFAGTTGGYLEAAFAQKHQVTFAGTPSAERPGFPPNLDIAEMATRLCPKPDLFVYVDSGAADYLPRGLERMACPTAVYLIDVNLGTRLRQQIAAFFDYVFVAQRDYAKDYHCATRQHIQWLPLACDTSIHRFLDLPCKYDVGFVGSVSTDPSDRRSRLLTGLEKRFVLNDFRHRYTPEEMAVVYNQSRIVFNVSIKDDINMRVFEAMSCKSLLITNRVGNGLQNLFRDGVHLVTYDSEAELFERVTYYLARDDERRRIAQAGYDEVRAHHTYRHRTEQILTTIFETAPGARAPLRDATDDELISQYARLYSMFRLLDPGFDMLHLAFARRRARLTALSQFAGALLRRVKYG